MSATRPFASRISTAAPAPRPSRPDRPVIRTSRRALLAALALSVVAVGCGTATGDDGGSGGDGNLTTLRYQGSSGAVTPAELAEDLGYLEGIELEWVGNTISGPQDIQATASGEIDFGGAFNGAVIKLAAANASITAVIGYYGVDRDAYHGYYVLEDSPIREADDLIGAKVAMNTLGAHAEAMLDIHLGREGLSADEAADVERLVLPPVNTEQALRQGQIEVAVLGGILRDKAKEQGGIRELFNDHDLLGDFSAGSYVFTDEFIERHPETVRAFVTGVGRAIEWSRTTPREEVIARMTDIVERRDRDESPDALRYWKSYGVAGTGGLIDEGEFDLWIDWLAERGEIEAGSIGAADLFTNEFNNAGDAPADTETEETDR
ncbi:ABC transporter substrate-binding protein [Streptomyces alkaliphilus]|uniref:ABC transporter substrate-binding protein n=1 Tax=Streptomyces alkaliphilus TaxID=1472722 RepID=A0A7W3TBX7_9ACTN|nr:ABC transporter substrate-binding protein [Streptomyces alkaliphilus]MBB0243938.1 ABC transporter substrate-binding protein [Streptomyces alkaliphilus]